MRHFVLGIVLIWIGVAAAALISFLTQTNIESPSTRWTLSLAPLYVSGGWWLLNLSRAKPSPPASDKLDTNQMLVLMGGIWIMPLMGIAEMTMVWSGSFHPVRDDATSPESMPAWWTAKALIGVTATLVSLWLLRRWSRGERWMFDSYGRVFGFTSLLYCVVMFIAYAVCMCLGFTERQARRSLSQQIHNPRYFAFGSDSGNEPGRVRRE